MIEQETGEDVLDSKPYFSPIFCGYLLNNWCGIVKKTCFCKDYSSENSRAYTEVSDVWISIQKSILSRYLNTELKGILPHSTFPFYLLRF